MSNHITIEQKAAYPDLTNELLCRAKEGILHADAVLAGLQKLIEGVGILIVDLDADPFVPDGWSVIPEDQLSVVMRGQFAFDPAKLGLYLSEKQEDDKWIVGGKLREELESQPVYNANLLDWLLKNQHFIPEEWTIVFFWGTIYRDPDGGLCVRYLRQVDDGWDWGCRWLVNDWYSVFPAAVSAS